MKKILLSIFFVTIGIFSANSQCSPNTSLTVPGIYPDILTNLGPAYAGTPFSEVIQVRVLTDTTYNGLPATVSRITVTGVQGLPAGFTYSCSPSNCIFPGGSNGCISLVGSPTVAQVGTYDIKVSVVIRGQITGIPIPVDVPDTVRGYKIVVSNPTSAVSLTGSKYELQANKPNPAINSTELRFNLPKATAGEIQIFDMLGNPVKNIRFTGQSGQNNVSVNLENLNPGVYFYTLNTQYGVLTRRLVISAK
jgi:hypothetical protein